MDLKKPTISLSVFTTLTESLSIEKPIKSPRSFENGGVGLSIVAAMNDPGAVNVQESVKVANFALPSPRSSPIPIVSSAKAAANFRGRGGAGIVNIERDRGGGGGVDVVNESDESYTCVISHVGNNVIRKHVYYGDQVGGFCDDSARVLDVNPGLFYASSSPIIMTISDGCKERNGFWTQDFLSSCYLCNKLLHGLDIFMYRGEKAFCSADCRDKQIRSENYKEKCGSEARKQQHDYAISPRSSPQVCFAGVAAA